MFCLCWHRRHLFAYLRAKYPNVMMPITNKYLGSSCSSLRYSWHVCNFGRKGALFFCSMWKLLAASRRPFQKNRFPWKSKPHLTTSTPSILHATPAKQFLKLSDIVPYLQSRKISKSRNKSVKLDFRHGAFLSSDSVQLSLEVKGPDLTAYLHGHAVGVFIKQYIMGIFVD